MKPVSAEVRWRLFHRSCGLDEPYGAGFGNQLWTISKVERIYGDTQKRTHKDSLMLVVTWPLGSMPGAESRKMNLLRIHGSVWGMQAMETWLERTALSRKPCSAPGLLSHLVHTCKLLLSIPTAGAVPNTGGTSPQMLLPCSHSFYLLCLGK